MNTKNDNKVYELLYFREFYDKVFLGSLVMILIAIATIKVSISIGSFVFYYIGCIIGAVGLGCVFLSLFYLLSTIEASGTIQITNNGIVTTKINLF